MFGMGFTEILMIAVVAILFIGPEKLPDTMVQIAKFINSFRKTINEAKSTFEEELHISELREEALNYRKTLQETTDDIASFKHAVPNPARELEEALTVAQKGLGNLDDGDKLHEEEPIAAAQEEEKTNVMDYKTMAREALEKAHRKEIYSDEKSPEPSAPLEASAEEPTRAEEPFQTGKEKAPRGFKNIDDGAAG